VRLLRAPGLLVTALTLALGSPQDDSRSPLLTPEQNAILDRVRAYATSYTASLPNFVCIQDTHRMIAEAKGKHWKPIDEITQKLNFVSGRESFIELRLRPKTFLVRWPSSGWVRIWSMGLSL
jgi:hypothetical protein